jgi:two-component sensor histidine kinase
VDTPPLEREMNANESVLLRELNHRINNELTSAICAVSVKAIKSDNVAVNVAKCTVSDNGSAPEPIRSGRGLTIVRELASSLGGRLHTSCCSEGSFFLLAFPLTKGEQRVVGAAHVGPLKRRSMRPAPFVGGRA